MREEKIRWGVNLMRDVALACWRWLYGNSFRRFGRSLDGFFLSLFSASFFGSFFRLESFTGLNELEGIGRDWSLGHMLKGRGLGAAGCD